MLPIMDRIQRVVPIAAKKQKMHVESAALRVKDLEMRNVNEMQREKSTYVQTKRRVRHQRAKNAVSPLKTSQSSPVHAYHELHSQPQRVCVELELEPWHVAFEVSSSWK